MVEARVARPTRLAGGEWELFWRAKMRARKEDSMQSVSGSGSGAPPCPRRCRCRHHRQQHVILCCRNSRHNPHSLSHWFFFFFFVGSGRVGTAVHPNFQCKEQDFILSRCLLPPPGAPSPAVGKRATAFPEKWPRFQYCCALASSCIASFFFSSTLCARIGSLCIRTGSRALGFMQHVVSSKSRCMDIASAVGAVRLAL